MTNTKGNIERLEEAGILKNEHFTDRDRKLLEGITTDEVDVLIKLRAKMGETPQGKEHMRPNIIV